MNKEREFRVFDARFFLIGRVNSVNGALALEAAKAKYPKIVSPMVQPVYEERAKDDVQVPFRDN